MDNYEHVSISPQLALATFRFLASCKSFSFFIQILILIELFKFYKAVDPFRSDYLSEEVLKALMERSIYYEAKGEARKHNIRDMSPQHLLYIRGEPADYFIMILEGRARIVVTKENQEYDAGPFCCFGISALIQCNATGVVSNSFDTKSEDNKPLPLEEGK